MNNNLLNEIIETKKISKSDLARKIGLSRQGLYNKLNGNRRFVDTEIRALAIALDLTDSEKNAVFFDRDVGKSGNT